MSGLDIYGHILSQPVRTVVVFAKLSSIEYTFHEINMLKGDLNTDEYKRINPYESMPAIVHDGFNVWESGAIISYLADAFNVDNQWYPKDIKIRARINAYIHWHHQGTREHLVAYIWAKKFAPKFAGAPELTEETEAPFKARTNEYFNTLSSILAETHYIARTAQLTIADIFAFNEIASGSMVPLDIESYPVVASWYAEIGAIPEVQEVILSSLEARKTLLGF